MSEPERVPMPVLTEVDPPVLSSEMPADPKKFEALTADPVLIEIKLLLELFPVNNVTDPVKSLRLEKTVKSPLNWPSFVLPIKSPLASIPVPLCKLTDPATVPAVFPACTNAMPLLLISTKPVWEDAVPTSIWMAPLVSPSSVLVTCCPIGNNPFSKAVAIRIFEDNKLLADFNTKLPLEATYASPPANLMAPPCAFTEVPPLSLMFPPRNFPLPAAKIVSLFVDSTCISPDI